MMHLHGSRLVSGSPAPRGIFSCFGCMESLQAAPMRCLERKKTAQEETFGNFQEPVLFTFGCTVFRCGVHLTKIKTRRQLR